MNRKCIFKVMTVMTMACLTWSCSTDEQLDNIKVDETAGWLEDIDPNQTWITSTNVRLNVVAQKGATITARTIENEKSIVLGEKVMKGNGVMSLDIPQGIGQRFGLEYSDGTPFKQYKTINITGERDQIIDVRFDAQHTALSRAAAPECVSRAATNQSLYGKSLMPVYGYMNFGSWAWKDVSESLIENKNASGNYITMIDYDIMAQGQLTSLGEFQAQETVILSFLYGYTGTTATRVLGYFVHSGDYSDIKFYDIADVLQYDYYDGKAKVQYQLDGKDVWYDANFDHKDSPLNPSSANAPARRGDDAYNTLNVYNRYKDTISAVRGLSYKLDIPQGKTFGFYLRTTNPLNAEQKKALMALGVPENRMPEFEANYSKAAMNIDKGKGKYRSALAIYDNFTFMGLDDSPDGGDRDCNDVTFALSNISGSKFKPTFTEETLNSELNQGTLNKHPEYTDTSDKVTTPPTTEDDIEEMPTTETIKDKYQRWTLCFEDGKTNLDFDFNDIVLHVAPITKLNKVAVWLMAAGGKRRTELYYNDGTKDIFLGEAHELFGVATDVMVNTVPGTKEYQAVLLSGAEGLNWPEGGTLEKDRARFFIKVYDYEGNKVENVIYGNSVVDTDHAKNVPEALCVMGEWEWPNETKSVETAYPMIGKWGSNLTNSLYWNWYSQPTPGTTKQWWQWWK